MLLALGSAHTWNEQLAIIGSNGSYTGAYGYPRGYIARTDPGFYSLDYLIPQLSTDRTRINASDLLCSPAQRTQNQTANYPRLTVAPGSAVAMKYLENGHVSLPQNQEGKPPKGGTVFVFGTTQPYDDETLVDVLAWTSDGSGGDKRGYLLAANDYDDGRCHQINSGTISVERQQDYPDSFPGQPSSKNELWCETDVVMPTDASIMPAGKLFTIYWVWQWPTSPGVPVYPTGKDEYYSTCSDFEVVAEVEDAAPSNLLVQQDPNTQAVSGYLSRTALTATPNVAFATATPGTASSYVSTTLSSSSSLSTSTSTSTVLPSTSASYNNVNVQIAPSASTSTTTSVTVPSSNTLTTSTIYSALSMTTLTITMPTTSSSTLSMTTLTITAATKQTTVPYSIVASSTNTAIYAAQPEVGSSGVLIIGGQTPSPTTSLSATPVVLTAVATVLATLQAGGGVAFAGYSELVFTGGNGEVVTVGGLGS